MSAGASRYRDDPRALAALVHDDRVHRDVYLDAEVFALERERLWSRAWIYVGHDSQVPNAGDYVTADVAGEPTIMLRQADGGVRVLMNRCAHKGAKLVSDAAGHAPRYLRCPYHAWTYRLDGSIAGIPLKSGYEGTRLADSHAVQGLAAPGAVGVHRGFVFARLARDGPSLREFLGEMASVIDHLSDRSPTGRLRIAGGAIRSLVRANWKIYLENINDTVHPVTTHESATSAAVSVWQGQPPDAPKPMSMQQMLPFGSGYDFFEQMGGRTVAGGHTVLGTRASIHSGYAGLEGYEASLREAWGEARAREILAFSPQNAVIYPSLSVKGSPQAIRVLRPLGPDRTLLEAWAFQPEGAPAELLRRAVMYNRLVFSPMSVVAHDDMHVFETIQAALRASPNPWVSLHRQWSADERAHAAAECGGTSERLMRHQYREWARLMAP